MTNRRSSPAEESPKETPAAFTVDAMLALPRLSGLALSPDGSRLAVSAAFEGEEGKKLSTAVYEICAGGEAPPRRLTRSKPGESSARFSASGDLLFTSSRPDPDEKPPEDAEAKPALWVLPKGGGEARPLAAPSGGVASFAAARRAEAVVFAAGAAPGAKTDEEDEKLAKARKDAGVSAQLFEGYPIRFWDHFLGPREPRLRFAEIPENEERVGEAEDLTPRPGRSLDLASFDLSPDGSKVAASRWNDTEDPLERRLELFVVDTGTKEIRPLASDEGAWYSAPLFSPDGESVVAVRQERATPEGPGDHTLVLLGLDGAERDLLPGFDLWPAGAAWGEDSKTLFFTADADGHSPAFRLDLEGGTLTRLSGEGAYSDLCPAPDGETLYALRSTVCEPPRPVALDARAEKQSPRLLPCFEEIERLSLPGDVVYDDVMRAVDGATEREDVDESRTVAMGGSFGGYMTNWLVGHTNRFRAAVTHASLWNLENFHGTTDLGAWWEREFGDPYKDPEKYREHSPHLHVADVETPTLVIHGELDYRVPISEALTLWTDLKRHGVEAKFLYFPDENHWVMKPNNSRIWYESVLGFIDHHARGGEWKRPELL